MLKSSFVSLFLFLSFKIIASLRLSAGRGISFGTKQTTLRMSSSIKFTSYNVLSSHLSGETHFAGCRPEWLNPSYRLNALKQKLDLEMKDDAIVCLQEVSHQWAGVLHAYCSSRGYHLVTACYGGKFNGYMGVAIAVPTKKYEIMDVDITRVSDTKRMPRKAKPGYVQSVFNKISKFFIDLAVKVGVLQARFDFWDNVLYRTNQMICMRLRSKEDADAKPFAIGTYHMPCMFKKPAVMVTHCALSAQLIQKFAKADPFVYVGDFNIKPSSSQYQLLTQGSLEKTHPDYPEIEEGDSWVPDVSPALQSAYVVATGSEPDFTNYAKVQNDPVFIETLDYIFHSSGWNVDSVQALPHRDTVPGPLPNKDEPSDHILISAKMSLK